MCQLLEKQSRDIQQTIESNILRKEIYQAKKNVKILKNHFQSLLQSDLLQTLELQISELEESIRYSFKRLLSGSQSSIMSINLKDMEKMHQEVFTK